MSGTSEERKAAYYECFRGTKERDGQKKALAVLMKARELLKKWPPSAPESADLEEKERWRKERLDCYLSLWKQERTYLEVFWKDNREMIYQYCSMTFEERLGVLRDVDYRGSLSSRDAFYFTRGEKIIEEIGSLLQIYKEADISIPVKLSFMALLKWQRMTGKMTDNPLITVLLVPLGLLLLGIGSVAYPLPLGAALITLSVILIVLYPVSSWVACKWRDHLFKDCIDKVSKASIAKSARVDLVQTRASSSTPTPTPIPTPIPASAFRRSKTPGSSNGDKRVTFQSSTSHQTVPVQTVKAATPNPGRGGLFR